MLKPFRRGPHLDTANSDSVISWSPEAVKNLNFESLSFTLPEIGHIRFAEFAGNAVEFQIGIKVTRHTPMGCCIHTVGSNLILYHGSCAELEIILGRRAYDRIFGKNHNALVAGSNAKFILGTYHSERFYSTNL